MTVVAIIPARFASTRLPGKALLDRTGKPLVCHVIDQASAARSIDRVLVATDDHRIAEAVRRHGGQAVMTRPDHPNGTSRLAEAAEGLDRSVDVIVNVQGDEPLVPPQAIDAVVGRLQRGDEPMATVASPFSPEEDPSEPSVVKVVIDQRGRAMYFSRSVIPCWRDKDSAAGPPPTWYKHVGLYAYRRAFLKTYLSLAPTPAEQAEKLEQLRVLEHGWPIGVSVVATDYHGIDTPEQYEQFVRLWREKHTC